MSVGNRNLTSYVCESVTPKNRPAPTTGANVNKGSGKGGAHCGDATNFVHPSRSPRRGNDSKTYRTFAGGESL